MLDELLDDYKESNDKGFIHTFINMLWNSKYKFKKYKKQYQFEVNAEKLDQNDDLVALFNKYNVIEYMVCRSYYKSKLDPIDYIRIHVNNMYGFLTDKEVYLSKKYYESLLTPKKEYYATIKNLKNGLEVDISEIEEKIKESLSEAEEIKNKSIENKLNLTWHEYKKLINTYIERLFDNYTPPHEYEKENGWELRVSHDGWSENNYIVKYFCKSLTGYLKNYVRDSKIPKKLCIKCNQPIGNYKKYCEECFKAHRKEYVKNKVRQHRKNVNNKRYLSE